MRTLTYTLVVLSALFSTGGVAIRSSADPAAPAAASPAVAEDESPKVCRPPQAVNTVRSVVVRPLAEGSEGVQLNSRGYNYQRPGEGAHLEIESKPAADPQAPAAKDPR